jgi:hypothetical protein
VEVHQTFSRVAGQGGVGINTDIACPDGKQVLGGGYDVFEFGSSITVHASRPLLTGPQSAYDGWRLTFSHPTLSVETPYELWVICADA